MKSRTTLQRGFTLVELMVVVAIIGILASIGIPAMLKYIRTAETSEPIQRLGKLAENVQGFVNSHQNLADTVLDDLDGKVLVSACSASPTSSCINYYIPQLEHTATSKWAYKVEKLTVESGKITKLCLGAKPVDATKKGAVYYSATQATSDASWQGNTHIGSYVNGVAPDSTTVTVTSTDCSGITPDGNPYAAS